MVSENEAKTLRAQFLHVNRLDMGQIVKRETHK